MIRPPRPLELARAALACSVLAPSAATVKAQDFSAPPTAPGIEAPVSCPDKTALYAAAKMKLWVLRRGTLIEDNPLRPLSSDPLVVLEVIVNGRRATAYGVDYANLRRAGAPPALEERSRHAIQWSPVPDGLPASFRVVAEDGALVAGPFAFSECGDAPKVADPKPVARRPAEARNARSGSATGAKAEGARPEADGRPGLSLPQGALPESALTKGPPSRRGLPQGAIQ